LTGIKAQASTRRTMTAMKLTIATRARRA